ncbi:pumilio homolog 11-like [Henckelia pumila]|uniref:pumilio homolog 11-like n=1 Tax=Henckelia pumila TaxID=405737 RepID=UPI003C6E4DA1
MENLLIFPINSSTPAPAGYRLLSNCLPTLQPNSSSADLKGKLIWTAMDPYGFRLLVDKLQNGKPEDIRSIFLGLKDGIYILMCDSFGSYVSQKLFQVCDEEQLTQLVSSVTSNVSLLMALCRNSRGSESVKKFLDCLKTPKQISEVMSVFLQHTVSLVNHRISSGVVSHCFHMFPIPREETELILDVITDNFWEIATNQRGSGFLLEILDPKVFRLESRPRIISAVIENAYQLSQHPFASNLVRRVIYLGMHDVVRDIVVKLRPGFYSLSMVKHGNCVAIALMKKARAIKYKEKCPPQFIYDLIIDSDLWKAHLGPYYKYDLQCAEECTVGTLCDALEFVNLQDNCDEKKPVLHKKKRKMNQKKPVLHKKKRKSTTRKSQNDNGYYPLS